MLFSGFLWLSGLIRSLRGECDRPAAATAETRHEVQSETIIFIISQGIGDEQLCQSNTGGSDIATGDCRSFAYQRGGIIEN
ncbi:hypothetical protein AOLI_G00157700 [Acnodon oligacanthus]